MKMKRPNIWLAPLARRMAFAGVAAGLVSIVLIFVVAPEAVDVSRPLMPDYLDAIADKEGARQEAVRIGLIRDSALSPEVASLYIQRPTIQEGRSPAVSYQPYSYRSGGFDTNDAITEEAERADSINLFFGGVGTSWDVEWDMLNDTYGNPQAPADYDPGGGHTRWQTRSCALPVLAEPQAAYVGGTWTNEENVDLHSRDIYVFRLGFCENSEDAH